MVDLDTQRHGLSVPEVESGCASSSISMRYRFYVYTFHGYFGAISSNLNSKTSENCEQSRQY